ncbi:MAG: GGDEF domain-containing protein [Pyrinomonadaceae bacterium]|nr:GGDEF domain-containing protein [Pyrinomonadaceae bacterium]
MISLSFFNIFVSKIRFTGTQNESLERIEFLTAIDNFRLSSLPYFLGVSVFTALNHNAGNLKLELFWLFTSFIVRSLFQFFYRRIQQSLLNENSDFALLKLIIQTSAILYGIFWGSTIFFFHPAIEQFNFNSFLILVVCLIAVISNYGLICLPRSDLFLLFAIAVGITSISPALTYDLNNSYLAALGFTIFISVQTFYSIRLKGKFDEQILLKMQNQELVNSLEENRAKMNQNIKVLEDLSLHDDLTQLPNRRFLMNKFLNSRLESEDETEFSLMILDLDNFKTINDRFGHLVGDKVLIKVAAILKNSIRGTDCAARVGGEEFVIFLPNSKQNEALLVAERIRQTIQNQIFLDTKNQPFQITTSIGLAESVINSDLTNVFQKADTALYEAKQEGKNRIKIATETDFDFSLNQSIASLSEINKFLN